MIWYVIFPATLFILWNQIAVANGSIWSAILAPLLFTLVLVYFLMWLFLRFLGGGTSGSSGGGSGGYFGAGGSGGDGGDGGC